MPGVLQREPRRTEDSFGVIVMREGVAAGDHVRRPVLLDKGTRHLVVKKPRGHVEPLGPRHFGDVLGNVHAFGADPQFLEGRDENAVVASKFKDQPG